METQELYVNDKKARLIGMPLISLIATILYHNGNFDLFNKVVLTGFFISLTNTFLIWEGTRMIFYKARKKYPNVEQTRKRLIYQSCIAVFYTLVITLVIDVFCYQLQSKDQFKPFTSFLIGLFANFIVTLLYETVFFFESWKINVRKTEALARENVQSQI